MNDSDLERADDLGLIPDPHTNPPPPTPLGAAAAATSADYAVNSVATRNRFAEEWMARSDYLCREFKDHIIHVSRDTRLAGDVTSTVLSGLATIFTAVGTIHPLAGAATIVSGVSVAAQNDTFAAQSGEIIASAIQTARENQANQIEINLTYGIDRYSIFRAERDVIDYHNMCSLETALQQIRASLKETAPDAGRTPPAAQGAQTPGGAPEAAPARKPPAMVTGQMIASATNPLPGPVVLPPSAFATGGLSPFERTLRRQAVASYQAALCVPTNDDLGPRGSPTRSAVRDYLAARGKLDPRSTSDLLDSRITTLLDEAVDDVRNCAAAGFKNAYEVGRYGVPAALKAKRIQELQRSLHTATGMDVQESGTFDAATRKAIVTARLGNGLAADDGQVDAALVAKITQ